jgi:hypothetical protein
VFLNLTRILSDRLESTTDALSEVLPPDREAVSAGSQSLHIGRDRLR